MNINTLYGDAGGAYQNTAVYPATNGASASLPDGTFGLTKTLSDANVSGRAPGKVAGE